MRNMEHAIRYLLAVQKKNKGYFTEHRLKIADCVAITGVGNAMGVSVTNATLPQHIKDDIDAMFWI
ncbi:MULTISPECIES: hypothetical protein [unclassified Mucilaginibacter]|uniref:hypothetical protein n=1 Tax=unclassified Mucilaginibacter TaxID=2617802 RepID=UPI002AC8EB8C|nr:MULTISPECIES: hypothetical protein [unclassified Mucilaginibacter]MEB0263614.1 hypothetical protein [Mucilaginibacter sp. 10I4]MEB0278631.1 hypothetical protein [Mucilaginibacter sp. 10B2]MEB0299341.1 hypothetical protein [Mucilaginibacter sp. 5C4]WPX23415.1 hypothetical protein RHM67_19250 [Mucilaginibacter sp. 5C4]